MYLRRASRSSGLSLERGMAEPLNRAQSMLAADCPGRDGHVFETACSSPWRTVGFSHARALLARVWSDARRCLPHLRASVLSARGAVPSADALVVLGRGIEPASVLDSRGNGPASEGDRVIPALGYRHRHLGRHDASDVGEGAGARAVPRRLTPPQSCQERQPHHRQCCNSCGCAHIRRPSVPPQSRGRWLR